MGRVTLLHNLRTQLLEKGRWHCSYISCSVRVNHIWFVVISGGRKGWGSRIFTWHQTPHYASSSKPKPTLWPPALKFFALIRAEAVSFTPVNKQDHNLWLKCESSVDYTQVTDISPSLTYLPGVYQNWVLRCHLLKSGIKVTIMFEKIMHIKKN